MSWTARQIPSQTGKLALITGANSGIGFYAALELARAGCEVILACRDAVKGEKAKEEILQEAPQARVEVAALDLSNLASVRTSARSFLDGGRPLDLLINNAGVMAIPQRTTTRDGFELQFGTNHLAHFALSGRLLPALLAAPGARIVTVSSLAHRGGRIRFDDLQWETGYRPWPAYRQSKLANLLFGFELERKLRRAGAPAISIVVHPGVAKTNLFANGPGAKPGLATSVTNLLLRWFGQSSAKGALPTLYGATSPDAHGGRFYGPDGFGELRGYPVEVAAEAQTHDEALAERLWKVSEELTGEDYAALGWGREISSPARG